MAKQDILELVDDLAKYVLVAPEEKLGQIQAVLELVQEAREDKAAA